MAALLVAGGGILWQRLRMQEGSKPEFTAHNNPAGTRPSPSLRAAACVMDTVHSAVTGYARVGSIHWRHMGALHDILALLLYQRAALGLAVSPVL
jgi:hypothetical protein